MGKEFKKMHHRTSNFRSWAGSAPVVYFQNGGIALDAFDNKTTQTLVDSGCNKETIINAFKAVGALSNLKF